MENFLRNFRSPFLRAFKAVKKLFDRGLDPDIQNFRNAFRKAIADDDSKAFKKLLDRVLDPNGSFNIDGEWKPAICLCAGMERTTLVEVLLQAGANVDQMDGYGRTSLHLAVLSNNVKMVGFLLSKGAEVNQRTSDDGRTPLHQAVNALNVEIVRLLIDAGADVDRRKSAMMTPLVYLCAQTSFSSANLCVCCFKRAFFSVLSQLLKAKSCVKSRDANGCNALHHIVREDSFGVSAKALELLLSYPCDVDAKNDFGETPLFWAVRRNNRKAVLLLLKAGCRVNVKPRYTDMTTVDVAMMRGFYDVAELLFAAGARLNRVVWTGVREPFEYVTDPSMLDRLLAVSAECPKLYQACRRTFYDHYGSETPRLIDKLSLPPLIKRYLTYEIV